MKTILKFSTVTDGFKDKFTITMPKGAEILTVQIDQKNNHPTIWAIVETDNELEDRYFELLTTGGYIHGDMGISRKYIGTYQYQKGEFVGHLFERVD